MDDRSTARALGIVRVLVGVGCVVAPRLATRVWTGEREVAPTTTMALRAVGGREVALGAGIVGALDRSQEVQPWLIAGAAADATDAVAILLNSDARVSKRVLFAGAAAAASATGVIIALSLDDH